MTGLSIIFNIRFRLLLITIITATALILQATLITDSQDTQSSIEDQGNRHLEFDAEILLDLAQLELIVEKMGRLNYENFIDLLLFNTVTGGIEANRVINEYEIKINEAITKLINRETTNYEIKVNETNDFGLMRVDADLISGVGDIINKQGVGDASLEIIQLQQESSDNIAQILENTTQYRVIHEEYIENFLTTNLSFKDNTVVNIEETVHDSIHNLDITELSVIQNKLNNSENTLAIIGIDPSVPVNESITLRYMFETKDRFYEIGGHIEEILVAWSNLLQVVAIRDGTSEKGLDQFITEFNFVISNQTKFINEEAYLINGTVLSDEQSSLDAIITICTDDFVPEIQDLVYLIESIYTGLIDIQALIDDNIYEIVYQVSTAVLFALEALNLESSAFSEAFTQILENVRENFYDLIQVTSVVLIIGITVLLLLTALQLIRSLRSMSEDYEKLSSGNIASLRRRIKYSSSEFGDMQKGFDDMVNNLSTILKTQQAASTRLASIAEELAAGAQEASASVIEVSETVHEFTLGASEQNLLLDRISKNLEEHLMDVEGAVHRIGEASKFVVKVAKRTNILGLNASIQAAKAGKFGLGFDVVADEVRNLSEETKESANQIADLIAEIEVNIKNNVEDMLKEVHIISEVAENTVIGSDQLNISTSEQVIMLNEISTTSNELSLLAQQLQEIIHRFTLN
ncbi:MAG: putative methyl-accepting chemotaxis protein YoaH [Candidatus Heimdallarchaeota archaeon LC_2]|nr:MAG: putative methyl-accepting chemotaxis protein YoaH [Candidatus Heimdallarchaeota archaeon LC_2]